MTHDPEEVAQSLMVTFGSRLYSHLRGRINNSEITCVGISCAILHVTLLMDLCDENSEDYRDWDKVKAHLLEIKINSEN